MNRPPLGFALLLVFQLVLVASLWAVDPVEYVGQRLFGLILAAQLAIIAIFLHLYLSAGEDYDQEWIAVGLAFIVLIGLLAYFLVTG
jgi:hypothetical protein